MGSLTLHPLQDPILLLRGSVFTRGGGVAGALASGTDGGRLEGSCVLIAGTGTIALGVQVGGRQVRAAGWGPLLGDRGSGCVLAACRPRAEREWTWWWKVTRGMRDTGSTSRRGRSRHRRRVRTAEDPPPSCCLLSSATCNSPRLTTSSAGASPAPAILGSAATTASRTAHCLLARLPLNPCGAAGLWGVGRTGRRAGRMWQPWRLWCASRRPAATPRHFASSTVREGPRPSLDLTRCRKVTDERMPTSCAHVLQPLGRSKWIGKQRQLRAPSGPNREPRSQNVKLIGCCFERETVVELP